MSNKKTTFRLAIHETPKGLREQNLRNKRNEIESNMVHENSPLQTPIWQQLTPELRAEAVRKAQLVQLLKQINPELQLCRKNSNSESPPIQRPKHTLDKGVQVPDIRFEFASNRIGRSPLNYSGLGVRIQPKPRYEDLSQTISSYGSAMVQHPPRLNQSLYSRPSDLDISRSSWRRPLSNQRSQNANNAKNQHQSNKAIVNRNVAIHKQPNQQESFLNNSVFQPNNKENVPKKSKAPKHVQIEILKQEEQESTDKKQAITSSGDDDSVVVVLNEPSNKEKDLERKYGQFFCRRCLRGWSSRNVWCVRTTNKVYIKQTCNACNKVVNPYLVYELPAAGNNKRDAPKWKQNKSSNDDSEK